MGLNDYLVTLIVITPPRPADQCLVDEHIYCDNLEQALEQARKKEAELQLHPTYKPRIVLIAAEISYKHLP